MNEKKQGTEAEGFNSLTELALNMRWSWNHATDEVWRQFDPELWELTHNPWLVLQAVSHERIEKMLTDPAFSKSVDDLVQMRLKIFEAPSWFQQNHSHSPLSCVAYFSMEFMLSEALPIYSGGLGNVAGDQLKATSDLGVPIIGVGLLYQQGYFRQVINKSGAQEAVYSYNDPKQLPITPLLQANGELLRLELALPGYSIWMRVWKVQVGRVKLYLLDSNDPSNSPADRGITSELYGGGIELRIKQELLLGIGGWQLLETLGIHPQVCHLNEGHAAFAVLERARSFMQKNDLSFDEALAVTRAGNLFTTHTAVEAGFDRFSPALIEQYLGKYAQEKLGIPLYDLLSLGRQNKENNSELFNMAYLAIHGSGSVNGVSRLHGEVSRKLFSSLFPGWAIDEVPINYVTNGVHMPSWDSEESDELWTKACGKDRWLGMVESLEQDIRCIEDAKLWKFRTDANKSFIKYARQQLSQQMTTSDTKQIFNPNVLTLGFARRFTTYKRPNLLLHDPERLQRILTNSQRPVQLVIAGKAHPSDKEGQALIKEWIHFIRRPEIRNHVIFLIDYDMLMAERLVQGIDVWINTPQRPWEASGTSGMKVLVNGGINLSELDGWWAEAYTPEVGWAIGDGKNHGGDEAWDAIDAEELYTVLEQKVIPEFYQRNKKGIPTAWVARMRESMARLTPQFSTNRTVIEYTEKHYIPAATTYNNRAANKGERGRNIATWEHSLKNKWNTLRFGEIKLETRNKEYLFKVEVYLNDIDPNAVRVEIYADGINGASSTCQDMKKGQQLIGTIKGYMYSATVSATRPAIDYTTRVIPNYDSVAIPLEATQILWQR